MEQMGFFAVVEGVQQYLENIKKMQAAQEQEAKSVQDVANKHNQASAQIIRATQQTSAAQQSATMQALERAGVVTKSNEAVAGSAEKAGTSTATNFAKAAGSMIAAAAAAAAMYVGLRQLESAVETTTKLGESVHQMEIQLGLSAEQASRLIYAANALGVPVDTLQRGLLILSRNMLQVQETEDGMINAATPAAKVLASLGIQVLDSNGKLRSMADLLPDISRAFESTIAPQQRAGVAMQLFGRSGAALLPFLVQGPEGIAKLNAESDKYGNTLSQKQVDAIHQAEIANRQYQAAIKGLQITFATEMLPTLTTFAQFFSQNLPTISALVDRFFAGLGGSIGVFVVLARVQITGLRNTFHDIADMISGIVDLVSDLAHGRWSAAWEDLKNIGLKAFHAFIDSLVAMFGLIPNAAIAATEAAVNGMIDVLNSVPAIKTPGFLNDIPGSGKLGLGNRTIFGGTDISHVDIPRLPVGSLALPHFGGGGGGEDATDKALGGAGATFLDLGPKVAKVDSQLKSLAAEFEKTGNISEELAKKLGLTAEQAGRVEGYDAVIRATADADKKSFEYSETLAKVAQAFQDSAKVASKIVLDLAQSALDAANKAAGDVLGKETVEQANLNLKDAQQKLQLDLVKQRVDPQLEILKRRGEEITKDTDNQVAGIEQQIKALQALPTRRGALLPPGVAITTGPAPLVPPQMDPVQMEINALKQREADIKKSGDLQKKAIDDQTAALTKQTTNVEDANKATQASIAIERDRVDIMRKELTLQDKTLLTDAEQRQKVQELGGEISKASGAVRTLSRDAGVDLVKSLDEARDKFKLFSGALDVLTKDDIRKKLVKDGFDYAGERAHILGLALDEATKAADGLAALGLGGLKQGGTGAVPPGGIRAAILGTGHDVQTPGVGQAPAPYLPGGDFAGPHFFAEGGFTSSPTFAILHPNEVVMPMSNVSRSQELFAQLPAGFRAQLMRSGGGGNSWTVSAQASGMTLEDMQAAAISAVNEAFRQARSSTVRSGSALHGRIG
jgi:hypothetical protein